jgi:hypothetical protein
VSLRPAWASIRPCDSPPKKSTLSQAIVKFSKVVGHNTNTQNSVAFPLAINNLKIK